MKIYELIQQYWDALWLMLVEMSPYLLLGFLIAGLLQAFVPRTLYARHLGKNNFSSVIKSALFGIPLPLCSCGVIPTAVSLRREGASKGACVSFLISTPQTGVDSIMATYSMMGLPFAVLRPFVALVTALLGGTMVNAFDHHSPEEKQSQQRAHSKKEATGLWGKLCQALHYGFVEMLQDVGKWLVIGLLLAALITVLVPEGFFASVADKPWLSMPLVLLLSMPMYLCATGSIPIAVSLMLKGLTPGAALVLLMAGPATNMASILVVSKVFGRRTSVLYLLSIVVGAVCFGTCIDLFLPAQWFAVKLMAGAGGCCNAEAGASWWEVACTLLFIALMAYAWLLRMRHGDSCSCGEEEHDGCGCGCSCGSDCSCDDDDDDDSCHCHEGKAPKPADFKPVFKLPSYTVKVTGMTCNHCRAHVEEAIAGLKGVVRVTVDLPTGIASIEGMVPREVVIREIEKLGYKAE